MSRTPHALITGGSRGIGLAIARLLALNNYRITIISRSPPQASGLSHTPSHIPGDISDPSFWRASSFGKLFPRPTQDDEAGRIDVLVNCAGLSQSALLARTEPEEIERIVDTNLKGMMLGTRFLLRNRYIHGTRGSKEGGGEASPVIINLSSLLGLRGGHGAVAYAASKAGVLGFTRALAVEQGQLGIRVNAIVPGYIETDMTKELDHVTLAKQIPLKRLGKPDEVASAALFLIQNQYAHNCVINIDGGLSAV